jgi:hypothetical protein
MFSAEKSAKIRHFDIQEDIIYLKFNDTATL